MKKEKSIPRHVAIIMDGNGRWAKERGKERMEGHVEGVNSLQLAIESAIGFGVRYVTVYAFSTENWGRPAEEVEALMELFAHSVVSKAPELREQGVKVEIIGDRSPFTSKLKSALDYIESHTKDGEVLTLHVALNYSSRDEIVRAMRKVATRVADGELSPESIDESVVSSMLDTASVPDPDLVIRTSGESRLSNFLLWQSSYAELYFPEVLWPDFDNAEFAKAIDVYTSRDRRYGLVKS